MFRAVQRALLAGLVGVLAVVVLGCGDDDDNSDSSQGDFGGGGGTVGGASGSGGTVPSDGEVGAGGSAGTDGDSTGESEIICYEGREGVGRCDSECAANEFCNKHSGACIPTDVVWVPIAGGTYQMGSNDGNDNQKPVHSVTVPDFELTKTKVTVSQYAACVDAGVCTAPNGSDSDGYLNWGDSGPKADRANHPVNGVDWARAREYCIWIGARLPAESEWEYAARSEGKDIARPWCEEGGPCPEATCCYAVMYSNTERWGCGRTRDEGTMEVCSKIAGNSAQGLCDMMGNVWEWMEDDDHDNYIGAPDDGSAWIDTPRSDARICRSSPVYGLPNWLRTTHRSNLYASADDYTSGIRCSRDAQ